MTQNWEQPELPFEDKAPLSGRDFKLKDHEGTAMIFVAGPTHPEVKLTRETVPAVQGCFVLLNGPWANTEVTDQLLFNRNIVTAYRERAGRAYVVRVELDRRTTIPGVRLVDASAAEKALANAWHEQHPGRLEALVKTVHEDFQATVQRLESADDGLPNSVTKRPEPAQAKEQPPSAPPPGDPPRATTLGSLRDEPFVPEARTDQPPF